MLPTWSVVIPWCDRMEIGVTIPDNHVMFARHSVELIIVNAGGDDACLASLVRAIDLPNLRSISLPGATFNRSLCANIGALVARGEYVCLLDADMLLHSDILGGALEHLERRSCYVTAERISESHHVYEQKPDEPDHSYLAELHHTREWITVDGRRCVLHHIWSPCNGLIAGDGLVLLRKRDLVQVGGLNSRLIGWGYEDTDFQVRLQLGLGLERVELGHVTHLTHDASARDPRSWRRNNIASTQNYARGDYLGTLAQDAANWEHVMPAVLADAAQHPGGVETRIPCPDPDAVEVPRSVS